MSDSLQGLFWAETLRGQKRRVDGSIDANGERTNTTKQLYSDDDSVVIVYAESVLLSMPTPDFSMPYNVITMTCTVMALFFGSAFNIMTRKLRERKGDEKVGVLCVFMLL